MIEPRLVASAWTSAGAASPALPPSISPVPIAERVAAIADAGFVGFGLANDDLAVIRDTIGFQGLRNLADERGIHHIEIELIERWWIPRGEPGNTHHIQDLLFEAVEALAPPFIKIGSEQGPRVVDYRMMIEPLRALARRAADRGTRVAIEPMPFSAIATLPLGAEIVAATGHPAAGLVVDAWHVFRAGTSLDDLTATLAPEMIFGVELDDAAPQAIGTLFEDTVDRRLLCGEGSFDLPGLVEALRTLGFDGPWGVEILSIDYRALPPRQALKLAAESALSVL